MSEPIYIIIKGGLIDDVVGNNHFHNVDFDSLESWCCPFCSKQLPHNHPESSCPFCTFDWALGDSDYDQEYLNNCYVAFCSNTTLTSNNSLRSEP